MLVSDVQIMLKNFFCGQAWTQYGKGISLPRSCHVVDLHVANCERKTARTIKSADFVRFFFWRKERYMDRFEEDNASPPTRVIFHTLGEEILWRDEKW